MAKKPEAPDLDFDVAIIGSGASGLTLALHLPATARVAVLSKGPLVSGSTEWAQGGVAAVLDEEDSIDSHVADTIDAGAGLCDVKAVRHIIGNSARAIEELAGFGVEFTREERPRGANRYHLTREGGHSRRRVVHAADATGREIEHTLAARVRERENITVFEQFTAVDLIREGQRRKTGPCVGFYVLDQAGGRVRALRARVTVIATGGASKVYLYTSNPDSSSGDGIAMAWRAGCRVANMEFTQFHPTCLYHPEAKSFLISEAVRGEGATLQLPDGTRFMPQFDDRAELAPRDVVARAIDHEMKRLGVDCVYLDVTDKPAEFIETHFPMIYARCLRFGFDMTKERLPVVPAAHYTCGGVMTDLKGRTGIGNLYAVGEAAYTGLHGANRMASNSLLECVVMAASAGKDIARHLDEISRPKALKPWDESWVSDSDEQVVVNHNWDELRRFMWDYVGIVRSTKRLERARHRIDLLKSEIHDYYSNFTVNNDLLELRNLVVVADLIVRSALARKESRGIHYTLDYPEPDDRRKPKPTVLEPAAGPAAAKTPKRKAGAALAG